MEPQLYRALQGGKWDDIKQYESQFGSQLAPRKNTVLHVLAQFHDDSFVTEQILATNLSLMNKLNEKNETALLIAARKGHFNVVQVIIDCAKYGQNQEETGAMAWKKMLRMTNENGDTALHVAVRSNVPNIVELLVKEDPELSHPMNRAEESPLYLAVERGNHVVAGLILTTCKSPSYGGPYGRTALHPAAIKNDQECMKLLLETLPNLIKEADVLGRTALHFAAGFNHQQAVRSLLLADHSSAYVKAHKDKNLAPLHIAVIHGHIDVVKELLLHCPDCWDMVTADGQNILHLAVENEGKEILDFIVENTWASELINQYDNRGNTPLHVYATKNFQCSSLLNFPHVDMNVFNKNNLTPLDLITCAAQYTEKQGELEISGATPGFRHVKLGGVSTEEVSISNQPEDSGRKDNSYLIIGTLIVTITFTAGFTIPGGYDNSDGPNKGLAVLKDNAFFNAFLVADFLALGCSVSAVFLQFELTSTRNDHDHQMSINLVQSRTKVCIRVAMVAMVCAFVSGLFAVVSSPITKGLLFFAFDLLCFLLVSLFLLTLRREKTRLVWRSFRGSFRLLRERAWGKFLRMVIKVRAACQINLTRCLYRDGAGMVTLCAALCGCCICYAT